MPPRRFRRWTATAIVNYPWPMTTSDNTPPGRRWHDMGGNAAGRVPATDHDHSLWEKRVDALMMIGTAKGLFTVDSMRRVLEDMPPSSFDEMSYYERWVASLNQNLIEAGIYTPAELGRRMTEVAARGPTYGEASRA